MWQVSLTPRDLLREQELGWFLSVADLTFLTECSWPWGGLRRVVSGSTHAWHPALFSLWTCVKMSDCAPVQRHPASPHGAVGGTRRLIIGNCLFRRGGQVLRKSSISWLFFFLPRFCKPRILCSSFPQNLWNQVNGRTRWEADPGLQQLYGKKKKKKWGTGLDGKRSSRMPRNWQTQSVKICPSLSSGHSAVVKSLSCVWLSVTPWTAARQALLASVIFWSLLRLTSVESAVPSNHLVLCRPPSPFAFHRHQHQGLFQRAGSLD